MIRQLAYEQWLVAYALAIIHIIQILSLDTQHSGMVRSSAYFDKLDLSMDDLLSSHVFHLILM